MKNIKLFNKILLSISIIFIMVILILFVLGSFNRIGYLSEFKINIDNTLKLNGFNVESVKESFTIDNVLDKISITNYLVTNISITNYSYDFRIKYYSKIFRNSDIYGVYADTNKIIQDNNFIKEIKFDYKGSPFGVLISDRLIENNINNIQYSLKIKFSFYIIVLLIFIVLSFFIYILRNFILNLLTFLSYIINSNITKYVFVLIIFLCFLIMPNIVYNLFGSNFDKTNYENRLKVKKPVFNISHLDKYPKEYEKYFNDYIPFRNELVQLKSLIDFNIFKNFFNKVLILKNGDITSYPSKQFISDNDILKKMVYNITQFKNYLNDLGIDLIVLFAVDKCYIYKNEYPKYINQDMLYNIYKEELFSILSESGINVIFPKNELLKYNNKYRLYYQYDDHWNNIAGYIVYMYMMNNIGRSYRTIDNVDILEYDYIYEGGIGYQISSSVNMTKFLDKKYYYYITNYSTNTFNILKGDIFNWGAITITSSDSDGNIAFLRDSMTEALVPYISSSFKNVYYVPWDDPYDLTWSNALNFMSDIENYNLDTFVLELQGKFVERLLTQLEQCNTILSNMINGTNF